MNARAAHSPMFGAQARLAEQERLRHLKKNPDLKLVNGGAKRRAHLSPRVRLLAAFVTAGIVLFGVVAFHVVLSQGQFKLQKLDARAAEAQAEYQKRRLEVAQLESPSRIEQVAQDRLGMVPAEKVTPVTPTAGDMPRTQSGSLSSTVDSTADDPGAWTSVKPHLSSTSQ